MAASTSYADTTKSQADFVIFDASKIDELLTQCSRRTPSKGEGSWTPNATDIDKLEAALPAALAKQPSWRLRELSGAPNGWVRQYVGLIRGGHRYIYGNFMPKSMAERDDWRSGPTFICDGGPAFFGVDYDAEEGLIVGLAFNGMM